MIITQGRRELLEDKDQYTHIISVVCPDDKIEPIGNNHYVAKMWDITETLKNKFREYKAPDLSSCLGILAWVDVRYMQSVREKQDFRLLVHCDAGVSRSAAVTLGVLWTLSSLYFKNIDELVKPALIRPYIEYRKEWCAQQLSEDSIALKRFIQGRLNPGVQPNVAILKHFRGLLQDFPW